MKGREILSSEDFKKCAEFHGHTCPGLAIGYRAAKAGLERLRKGRAADEELAAVIETDACGADAVQVLTGCTFGKGNLIFKDHGKQVLTLFGRVSGEGFRVSMKPGDMSMSDRQRELIAKIREDNVTQEERKEFEELYLERTCEILDKPLEELFRIEATSMDMPAKARIMPSVLCDRCNEPTMSSKLIDKGGEKFCGECAEKEQ